MMVGTVRLILKGKPGHLQKSLFTKNRHTLNKVIYMLLINVYRYPSFPIRKIVDWMNLIYSFELSDDSSGSYFRNFMTGLCGPILEDGSLLNIKPKPENHAYSYNLA